HRPAEHPDAVARRPRSGPPAGRPVTGRDRAARPRRRPDLGPTGAGGRRRARLRQRRRGRVRRTGTRCGAHRRAHPGRTRAAHAAGRTLARPVLAAVDVPAFDNAAVDGYAVRGPGPWRIAGRILAGHPTHTPLSDGQAVEIATGAPLPPGTERVLRYEDSHRD